MPKNQDILRTLNEDTGADLEYEFTGKIFIDVAAWKNGDLSTPFSEEFYKKMLGVLEEHKLAEDFAEIVIEATSVQESDEPDYDVDNEVRREAHFVWLAGKVEGIELEHGKDAMADEVVVHFSKEPFEQLEPITNADDTVKLLEESE